MSIESYEYEKDGYKTLIKFGSWRVAMLNSSNDQKKENLKYMERHNETDEVFVLLKGTAYIIDGGTGKVPVKRPKAVKMKKDLFYNVTKSHWHTTIMAKNSKVLIVENLDTSDDNSDVHHLTEEDKKQIRI